jgi:hypothetical protein
VLELRRRQRHPITGSCSLCQPALDAFQIHAWFLDNRLAGRVEWLPLDPIENPDDRDLCDLCAEPARRPIEVLAWDLGRQEGQPAEVATIYVGSRHERRSSCGPVEWRWILSGAYEPHRVRMAEPD